MVLKVLRAFIAAASTDILASPKHGALAGVIVPVFIEFSGFYLELSFQYLLSAVSDRY